MFSVGFFPQYGFVKSVLVCAASNNVRASSEVLLSKTLETDTDTL